LSSTISGKIFVERKVKVLKALSMPLLTT